MAFPDFMAYNLAAKDLSLALNPCSLCPRACRVTRMSQRGFCGAGLAASVNLGQLHFGEEPPISGSRGSGTVFFSGCTLHCLYCQNHQISRSHEGAQQMGVWHLAELFLDLQEKGAHNINLVSPTPYAVIILKSLALARENGLSLPIVYNTSGYEKTDTLRQLAGLIDIYLPDYKYPDPVKAKALSAAADYPLVAQTAIAEMLAQVGHLRLDADGIAQSGLMVRHLVLPNHMSDTPKALEDIARICGTEVYISLMAQYTPMYKAGLTPGLERPLHREEYEAAVKAMEELGLDNGFIQKLDSAGQEQIPLFHGEENPGPQPR
jgi:putative pyruvate formate lyase activating enzyme